jgi:hypothetical protein
MHHWQVHSHEMHTFVQVAEDRQLPVEQTILLYNICESNILFEEAVLAAYNAGSPNVQVSTYTGKYIGRGK